jgi:putative tricarboxylic transport membrane protein
MTPLRVAGLLLSLCAVAGWQVTQIPQSALQSAVGPVLVPGLVVGGLTLLALAYGWSARRGDQVDESLTDGQQPLPGAGRRLIWLLGGGLAFGLLVVPLGFVVPAALCGMGVARAFDAPWGWKSALVCGGVAGVFWSVFALWLGVGLGPAVRWPGAAS